jgi:hypothetical protein
MRPAALLLCAAVVPSCVSPGREGDREPPTLVVSAPERAARLANSSVVVSGRASDAASGVASVSVSGIDAEVDGDGGFQVEVPLAGGVSLLEVIARDGAGNEARDVRAVLSGQPSEQSVIERGLMARIGPGGYGVLADAVRAALSTADLAAAAAAAGALMAVPGCFEVRMVDLQHGAIDVDLQPRAGGVAVTLAVHDVVGDLRADIDGFCDPDGSSEPMRLSADTLVLSGTARLVVSGGHVRADLAGLVANFDAIDLDTGLLPAEVADLLGDAPAELASALGDAIGALAGAAIGDSLGDFDAVEWSTAIQGLATTVRLAPTAVDAGDNGLAVVSSVELRFDGLGPVELVTDAAPAQTPRLEGDSVLRVAVADDVANLTLAALWTGGLLDRSVALAADNPARTRLGLDRVDIALPLPPMVTSRDGSARIVIGDAVVTAYDLGGAPVMRLAASAIADLALSGAGGAILTLIPDQAELWISPLDRDGATTLDVPEPLRLVALDELARFLADSLSSLPVPDLSDVAEVSGLAAVPGYVVLDADLAAP